MTGLAATRAASRIVPMLRRSNAAAWLGRHGWRFGLELGVTVVLPLLVYDAAAARFGDVGALLAASAPPMLWSLAGFVRNRRVDALSLLVLAGILLSLLAVIGGGSAKLLQLRENLVTALIGLAFLGSAAIGRPLIYLLARAGVARRAPAELAGFEAKRDHAGFRRTMMVMTLVWGVGLLVSALLACALVVALSIRTYLIVGPFVGYGAMGALALWTAVYRRRARRRAGSEFASHDR